MAAKTHPVEATPDIPLFCCAEKRGLKVDELFYKPLNNPLSSPSLRSREGAVPTKSGLAGES
jgi:hypothetical protein